MSVVVAAGMEGQRVKTVGFVSSKGMTKERRVLGPDTPAQLGSPNEEEERKGPSNRPSTAVIVRTAELLLLLLLLLGRLRGTEIDGNAHGMGDVTG